jgi:ectoine hydroxylase-related dioxygenase (phytanoyl-CoA dioxygenase family)
MTSASEGVIGEAAIAEAVAHYREHGWARLGRIADEPTLAALRARTDAIMTGEITYEGMFFQHDAASGNYDDLAYGEGWCGPSLEYRKIEKLEKDPLFLAWLSNDVFRRVAARVYEGATGISLYRAFIMNKHAGGGSNLPWHQDGGKFWGLDRDPVLQLWTGFDDAPLDGGCLEVVEGTHTAGLATPLGGVVPNNHLERVGAEARALAVPTVAGEVLLIHNHLWHRSGRTQLGKPRRGFSVCYMDAATRCRRTKRAPREFFRVW